MPSKLVKENYTIEFQGVIWKQFIHPTLPLLLIEERLESELSTAFTIILINEGEILTSIIPEESWWETIKSFDEKEIITTLFGEQNAENKEERKYHFDVVKVQKENSSLNHPLIYKEEENKDYFEEVKLFIKETLNEDIIFSLEYLEYNELIIIFKSC